MHSRRRCLEPWLDPAGAQGSVDAWAMHWVFVLPCHGASIMNKGCRAQNHEFARWGADRFCRARVAVWGQGGVQRVCAVELPRDAPAAGGPAVARRVPSPQQKPAERLTPWRQSPTPQRATAAGIHPSSLMPFRNILSRQPAALRCLIFSSPTPTDNPAAGRSSLLPRPPSGALCPSLA